MAQKTIRFDSIGGASGDMILAALIALGADKGKLIAELQKALPDEEFSLDLEAAASHGLNGFKLKLEIHEGHHHHHHHDHEQEHHHDHQEHHGRHLADILRLIDAAGISSRAKENARKIFTRLGQAEAKVHQKPLETIHFHEVGAVDSIIDILGACIALDSLGVEAVDFGPLPEGQGTFQCQHGIYPIPAPATAELMKGFAVAFTEEPFELVTPTGAAILTTLKTQRRSVAGRPLANAIAFGTRKLNGRPNALRATLIEELAEAAQDACVLLETNLDDTTPEIIGSTVERLLSAGALDVWTTPIAMKKQRPGALLSTLCETARREEFERLLFEHTGTFGIRVREVERRILERRFEKVQTPYGEVSVKIGSLGGREMTRKAEFEDCRKLAEAAGVPVKEVLRHIK